MRKLRLHSFYISALLGFASLSIPLVSSAAAAPHNLSELVNMLVKILNAGATFLILLALIILFWNILKNILKKNGLLGKESTPFSRAIMWGIAGLFVMVSIWGIIRILQGTLFGNGGAGANMGGTAAPLQFTLPTVQ